MTGNPYARYERVAIAKLGQLPPVNSIQPNFSQSIQPTQRETYRSMDYQIQGGEGDDKVRYFEGRLALTERANQALLEEIVRMQGDLRNHIRRTDEALQSEHANRQAIENAMLGSRDTLHQTSAALKRSEEKRSEDRDVIGLLVGQVKALEQQMLLALKETSTRRDIQSSQLDELYKRVEESNRGRENMERLAFAMQDELQRLNIRYDVQQSDFFNVAKEFKNKSAKLEFENKLAYENLRKTTETQSISEYSSIQLKSLVDQRLSEVNDAISDLRTRQDVDKKESKNAELRFNQKLTDIQSSMSELSRRRDEIQSSVDSGMRERDARLMEERRRLETSIGEAVDDLSKKQIAKDARTREELQSRLASMEQSLNMEVDSRERLLKSVKNDIDSIFESCKRMVDDARDQSSQAQSLQNKRLVDDLQLLKEKFVQAEQKMVEFKTQEERKGSNKEQERKKLETEINSKLAALENNLQTQNSSFNDKILFIEKDFKKMESVDTQILEICEKQNLLSQKTQDLEMKLQSLEEVKRLQADMDVAVKNEENLRLIEIEKLKTAFSENSNLNLETSKKMEALLSDVERHKLELAVKLESEIKNLDIKLNGNVEKKIEDFNLQLQLTQTRVKSIEVELEENAKSIPDVPIKSQNVAEELKLKEDTKPVDEIKQVAEEPKLDANQINNIDIPKKIEEDDKKEEEEEEEEGSEEEDDEEELSEETAKTEPKKVELEPVKSSEISAVDKDESKNIDEEQKKTDDEATASNDTKDETVKKVDEKPPSVAQDNKEEEEEEEEETDEEEDEEEEKEAEKKDPQPVEKKPEESQIDNSEAVKKPEEKTVEEEEEEDEEEDDEEEEEEEKQDVKKDENNGAKKPDENNNDNKDKNNKL